MAASYAVGSLLFLIAAVASLFAAAGWIGATYVAGSVFFTAAAAVQLVTASEVIHRGRPKGERQLLRPRSWLPHRVDWVSAAIQFPGTVLFNVNTIDALDKALTTTQSNVRVWAPDMLGSICFLVSSLIAFANAEHRWISWRPGDLDWWITGLNLAGSLFFGLAAIASFNRPADDSPTALADQLANGGTALGAVCFLIAAVLLIPAQRS
jgi:hypothetical protein